MEAGKRLQGRANGVAESRRHPYVRLQLQEPDDLPPAFPVELGVEAANEPVQLYWEPGGTHELEPSPGFHAALRAFLQKYAPL